MQIICNILSNIQGIEFSPYLLGFLVIIFVRFLMNISKYLYLANVIRKQEQYVMGITETSSESQIAMSQKAYNWITENQIEIRNVVMKTGIDDQIVSYMEPLGLGFANKQKVSPLDNLAVENIELLKIGRQIVSRAKGYYKHESIKSFNPLYWIELIIFLPRELSQYLGFDNKAKTELTIVKIVQIIYWTVSMIFMYLNYIK